MGTTCNEISLALPISRSSIFNSSTSHGSPVQSFQEKRGTRKTFAHLSSVFSVGIFFLSVGRFAQEKHEKERSIKFSGHMVAWHRNTLEAASIFNSSSSQWMSCSIIPRKNKKNEGKHLHIWHRSFRSVFIYLFFLNESVFFFLSVVQYAH